MPPKRANVKSNANSNARRSAKAKAMSKANAPKPSAKLDHDGVLDIFRRFDMDGDGALGQNELSNVLTALSPGTWTDAAVARLFKCMDVSEDGSVSVEEFLQWVFGDDGGGAKSFKGALEIAGTPAAEAVLKWSQIVSAEEPFKLDLARELEHIRGADITAELQGVSLRELEVLCRKPVVPEPIRRVLEAVSLLLLARGTGVSDLTPPTWASIQHSLTDASFLQRVQNCDQRRRELRKMPMLRAYVADVYFHTPAKGTLDPMPLTYNHVVKASQLEFGLTEGKSSAVVLLYRWCLAMLQPELEELHQRDQNGTGPVDEGCREQLAKLDDDFQRMLDEL